MRRKMQFLVSRIFAPPFNLRSGSGSTLILILADCPFNIPEGFETLLAVAVDGAGVENGWHLVELLPGA